MSKTITAFDNETLTSVVLHLDGEPTRDEIKKAVYLEFIEFDDADDPETMTCAEIEDLYDTVGIYVCSVVDGLHSDEWSEDKGEPAEGESE